MDAELVEHMGHRMAAADLSGQEPRRLPPRFVPRDPAAEFVALPSPDEVAIGQLIAGLPDAQAALEAWYAVEREADQHKRVLAGIRLQGIVEQQLWYVRLLAKSRQPRTPAVVG